MRVEKGRLQTWTVTSFLLLRVKIEGQITLKDTRAHDHDKIRKQKFVGPKRKGGGKCHLKCVINKI